MTRLRLLLVGLASIVGCASRDQGFCTDVGCSDSTLVTLQGTALNPADYRIYLDLGRGEVRCSPAEATCAGDPDVAMDGPFAVRIQRVVTTVTLRVAKVNSLGGESIILEQKLSPSYERVQPNGSSCPPTCDQAKLSVRVGA